MERVSTDTLDRYLAFSAAHRWPVILAASALIGVIAVADWWTVPLPSLGFLYVIPIFLVSPVVGRILLPVLALACSVLLELFYPEAWQPGYILRMSVAFGGFMGTGFFISELERKRRDVSHHLQVAEEQTRLREAAERQMRVLIETSPLGILTINRDALVLLANRSAHELLAVGTSNLAGRDIRPHLPILERLLRTPRAGAELRTTVECSGWRENGEVFLAHVWLSTFATADGPALAAVVWDASENLRDREGTGLDSMMRTSRVLVGALSHEVRNLSAAGLTAHRSLGALDGVRSTGEYQALEAILAAVSSLATSGLQMAAQPRQAVTDLGTLLDQARIVIEPEVKDLGATVEWLVPARLPRVRGDQHSLLQVLLNLSRNSQRAIGQEEGQGISLRVSVEGGAAFVRFADTGPGVAHPEALFQPFQSGAASSGLGLYISRAILRSHAGDLRYEPTGAGSCFIMELCLAGESPES